MEVMEDAKKEPYKKVLHPKHKDVKAQVNPLPHASPPKKKLSYDSAMVSLIVVRAQQ